MPKYQSLQEVQRDLAANLITCESLVRHYLSQVELHHPSLNIYIEVFEAEALERAIALDKKYRQTPEKMGKLFGMVTAIKDVICYKDHAVTAGSKILEGFVSLFSSTAVERLLDQDAIIIGRSNCDEFAMGSSNESSHHGATLNAADPRRVPGGSSGGSAVAVQADTCLTALGSDTGGSVRQPAAFCGAVGLKPTYGRISRYGLLAYASSFDQIGVFANSVADAALMLQVMAGADAFDATASTAPVAPYAEALSRPAAAPYKIAYFHSALHHERLDGDIKARTFALVDQLQADGHLVESIDFEYLDALIPTYYVLTTAEASSNLSRYDGIRYGYRSPHADSLYDTYARSRTEGFGEEVRRRIMLGTFVLSAGYYDAYYTKAQKVRRLLRDRVQAIFANYDFILMPTTPTPAFLLGACSHDPIEMYLADIYTVLANLTGIPAISVPMGTNLAGLPLGVQLLADAFEEEKLLQAASYLHQRAAAL